MRQLRRVLGTVLVPLAAAAFPFMLWSALGGRWDNAFFETDGPNEERSYRLAMAKLVALRTRDVLEAASAAVPRTPGFHVLVTDTTVRSRRSAIEIAATVERLRREAGFARPAMPVAWVVESGLERIDGSGHVGSGRGFRLPLRAGDPCLVIVSAAQWSDDLDIAGRWAATAVQSSPCMLFAAFGMPAPALSASLDSIDWTSARGGRWWGAPSERRVPPPMQRKPFEELSLLDDISNGSVPWRTYVALLPCIEQPPRGCGRGVLSMFGDWRSAWVTFPRRVAPGVFDGDWQNYFLTLVAPGVTEGGRVELQSGGGRMGSHLMADMVRHLGPERFARLWTTDRPLPEAYAAVAGESFDAFVARWLGAEPGPRRVLRGSELPPADWWWLTAIVAVALGWTLWAGVRREAA
ncbi:MAG: hypothetical protein LW922_10775 [Gemmatimonadetes bacterium]|jgi:hypothetical protein|nr:hypothetical protein [Gemmatimonadota bacterium]